MKYLKLEISDNPFDEPKRVLTFGKFKGHTIKEVYDYNTSRNKNGYLEWCLDNIDGFKDELNEAELEIAESDYFRGVSNYGRDDWESPSCWFGAEDGYICCM